MATAERFFPPDHPAAQGHFPGDPIIPGAVLLSETLRAIEANLDASLTPCQIKSAKFFAPARPGDRIVIEFSRTARGEIRFTCRVEGRSVLTGQITCHAISTAE